MVESLSWNDLSDQVLPSSLLLEILKFLLCKLEEREARWELGLWIP